MLVIKKDYKVKIYTSLYHAHSPSHTYIFYFTSEDRK